MKKKNFANPPGFAFAALAAPLLAFAPPVLAQAAPGYRSAEQAYGAYAQQRYDDAARLADEALAAEPGNADYRKLAADARAATAYQALRAGDDASALARFEQAAAAAPPTPTLALDAAYTAKRLGRTRAAREWLRRALDGPERPPAAGALSAQQRADAEAELAPLDRRVRASALLSYGPVGLAAGGLPSASGNRRNVTQVGGELFARPLFLQPDTGGGVELFARYFETLRDAPGAPTGSSTGQGSAGLRWRPWLNTNLVLEAARLVKIGDASRNDTQLRVAYSLDHGTGPAPGTATQGWPAWRVYAEADRFTQSSQTIALAEAQYGRNFAVGPAGSRMTLFPHVLLAGSYDDSLATPSAWSTGLGVTQRVPLGAATGFSALDFTLQYRVRLAGDEQRAKGVFFLVSARF